jgi:hypothetical protein
MLVRWNDFGGRFEIDEFTRERLKKVYPFFERELAKMEVWYMANKAKQKKNHYRFMVNWLNKHMEKVDSAPKPFSRDYKELDREFKEKVEKAKDECAPPPDDWRKMMETLKRFKHGG